jgi:hypothetical protein
MNPRVAQDLPSHLWALAVAALSVIVASCGGNDEAAQEIIQGKVMDGYISGAVVCLDANGNGRCDEGEQRTPTDASGAYQLSVPAGSSGPLIAEIRAGQSRDSDQPDQAVDSAYRMASPSKTYSADITPFTTLVHLRGERDFALAEDLVRNDLGLPPRFDIRLTAAPAPGTLTQAVAKSIVIALKAAEARLDMASADALQTVVAAFPAALTELPQLQIWTKDAAPIESKEVYVEATFKLTNPAISMQPYELNGKIRGRGHTTWGQPKNPYKVQFSNDAAYAKVPDFLGMKKNRNWALLADHFDRSLMRNKLALSLGSSSVVADGLKWTPSGQHLEVWLNGDYVGVYLLTEDIRIDPARLDIKKMSAKAEVNDVDGGYIVEVDARLDCYSSADVDLRLFMPRGALICIDTPDEEAITQAQLAYIKGYLRQVEEDLYAANRLDKINAVSFADWYLLQELFKNLDAVFFSSDFMWKDTDSATNPQDRLLNMGPIWDFDRAAGNSIHYETWRSDGCWITQPDPRVAGAGNWFSKIFDNRDFLALTLQRWKLKRPNLERFVNASIDTYARRLEQAQQRNFTRWPTLGEFLTNYYTFYTYEEEVAFVRRFLNERIAWLDRAYASPEAFAALCMSASPAVARGLP